MDRRRSHPVRGGSGRTVALWMVWSMTAACVWAISASSIVTAEETTDATFEARPVAPLPSTSGERMLDEPEGESVGPLAGPAERDSVFDPQVSVLDDDATTETRAIYDNVDGTRTAVLSPAPVRYREDGEWHEIDLSLIEGGDGDLLPTASPAEVTFPTDAAEGVAVHESAAGPIIVGLPSVVVQPADGVIEEGIPVREPDQVVVEGDRGVESVVTPLSTGFEHDVVFDSKAVAVSSFTVELAVPNGVIAESDDTGVALRYGEEVIGHYGGGVAFDAGVHEGEGDDVVVSTTLVGQQGGTVTVNVSVDGAWLADTDRQFPVTIDPTYTSTIGETSGGGDTFASSASPTTSHAAAVDLRVGRDGSGAAYRSFLKFGISGIPAGALITDAKMQLVAFYATSCTPTQVRTRSLTAGFSSTTTWNTQPAVGGVVSDTNVAKGATGCPGGWATMDVASAVSSWYANPSSNLGIRLSADEATTAGYKRFYSSAYGSGMSPKLVVTYDRWPPEPVRVSPTDAARVPTDTPTLSVNPVNDPDGDAVSYSFSVWAGDGLPMSGQITRSQAQSFTSWTVPAGALADGVTYAWAASARGGDGWFTQPTTSGTFTIDRRLEGGPAPVEAAGPISVNLATGDAGYTSSSAGPLSLGGGVAPSYSYHSSVRPETGLTGAYYTDSNNNALFDDGLATMIRTDSTLSHDWTTVTPFDGVPSEQYMVRWTGFMTVPATDTYHFGASGSNGFKIVINGTTVVNRWPGPFAFTPAYGTGLFLTAGQTVPITVEMLDTAGDGSWMEFVFKNGAATDLSVPASWLTPSRRTSAELSPGWELDLGRAAPAWEWVRASDDALTLYAADGSVLEFDRTLGGGFVSSEAPDAVAALDTSGLVTVHEGGTTYAFGADGTLASASDGPVADSTTPLYAWTTTTTGGITYRRISTITDPVSDRDVTVTWRLPGATCPAAPAGFDANPPTGSLCKVSYWDGTSTSYFYAAGQLARIVDPGGDTTDFGYTGGILTSVRDGLAHDAVARGVRADDVTTRTQIVYTAGKATKVTLPAPMAGAQRPETTFTYGAGTTDVAVAGATNSSGYTRRAAFDPSGRTTSDTDQAGAATTTTWNPGVDDEMWATTGPDGARRTYLFGSDSLLTDVYGPAPATWFGIDRRPLPAHLADVPHESVDVDEGLTGLATAWFEGGALAGEPVATETGTGGTWASSPVGTSPFSGRLTGRVTFATVGTYTLSLAKAGYGRMWIDGTLVIDGWAGAGNASGAFETTVAGEVHQVRVDYASLPSGTSSLALRWTPPGGSDVVIPTAHLAPAYGVTTGTGQAGLSESVAYSGTGGNGPEDGAPSSVTVAPGVLGLATSYTYEPDGSGWQRPLTRTLPAGNTWTYSHYGGSESRDNPCTGPLDPAIQGGLPKMVLRPAASDGTARSDETVYDSTGRPVATRIGTEPWTCVTYDTRGRVLTRAVPAFGGAPARTVSYDWAVGGSDSVLGDGSPLAVVISDAAGSVATEFDLFGRPVSAIDVWGSETATTYDRAGRVIGTDTSAGGATWNLTSSYASTGLLDVVSLDGKPIADPSYDPAGRLSTVLYPAGSGNAGNGTSLDGVEYDHFGRLAGLTWKAPGGTLITSDEQVFDRSGRVIDQAIDGVDATPTGPSFSYDAAGRLTTAVLVDRNSTTGLPTGTTTTHGYGFAQSGGCGLAHSAGRNTNRSSLTINGVQTAAYCYDNADRLTGTSQPGYTDAISYDAHGNVVQIAGEQREYDGSDRHRGTTKGSTTVSYVRDALERVVERRVNGVTSQRYVYGDHESDSPSAVIDGVGLLITRTISLIGGVTYTDSGPGTSQSWFYASVQGHIAAVAGGNGSKVGPTRTYDPFGNATTAPVDSLNGKFDWGWLGAHHRPLEHESGLRPTIEMGERQYDPALGRFLEADPVEGGSCNDYEYVCSDPLSSLDLDGRWQVRWNRVCLGWLCHTVGVKVTLHRKMSLGVAWVINGASTSLGRARHLATFLRNFYPRFAATLVAFAGAAATGIVAAAIAFGLIWVNYWVVHRGRCIEARLYWTWAVVVFPGC